LAPQFVRVTFLAALRSCNSTIFHPGFTFQEAISVSLQPSNDQDLQRELQATLAARHELGPEYDEHFINQLTERLTRQVREEMAKAPKPRNTALSPEQRIPIAVCSMIFGIPLVAIAAGTAGPVGLVVAFLALILINVAAGISW
jgi:hypothetical protein